jgi:hypothetical protein
MEHLRMCVDYRALYKITVKTGTLARIDDLLDMLNGAIALLLAILN